MDPSHSGAQWSWPDGLNGGARKRNGFPPYEPVPAEDAHLNGDANAQTPEPEEPAEHRQRHYKPRICRICLETVQPTTEIDDSIAAGLFKSRAHVRYISEDPELGRLISPCLCKGSQKYVHEGCLQAWRQASPLSDRNFWRCPTCQFEYRLSRLRYGRWLTSKWLRAGLTVLVLMIAVFLMGFVADPIINFWVDPLGAITDTISDVVSDVEGLHPFDDDDDEPDTWSYHFLKGFFSLGLVGFLKSFLAMSPWHWFNIRANVGRRRGTGRDRLENVNLALVIFGIITFLGATWKVVSHLSARALEKASDSVLDVQGDDPDDDDDDEAEPAAN